VAESSAQRHERDPADSTMFDSADPPPVHKEFWRAVFRS
jgi:hypothetical protein